MAVRDREHAGAGHAYERDLQDVVTPPSEPAPPLLLPPLAAGIALWWCELTHDADHVERLAACLSPAEHARAARFGTAELRRRWIAGRVTLRRLLGTTLGVDPADVAIERGPRGRPRLADDRSGIDFNVSNTRLVALIAIARALPSGTRVGVDVEHEERAVGAERLAVKFLTTNERATLEGASADEHRRRFLHYWTCKEAMSKATGDGLAAPFRRLDVDLGAPPRLVDGPPPYEPARWTLHTPLVPSGYRATLAVWDSA
jgi:4'-phosphopantetheinyl transferase